MEKTYPAGTKKMSNRSEISAVVNPLKGNAFAIALTTIVATTNSTIKI
jgi:hypothetical protein